MVKQGYIFFVINWLATGMDAMGIVPCVALLSSVHL